MKEFSEDVKKAVSVMKDKGIILYPTDTVWGIGCDATSKDAVDKIFTLKKRDRSKSMILLLDDESRLASYVREIPEQAYMLIEFSEKPLTIIYEGARNLPPEVIADDGSVAIRVTKDEFCREMIRALRKPVISTSANISGNNPPASFSEIETELTEKVDYVVNWRQSEKIITKPSTIVRLMNNGTIEFIRH